MLETCLYCDDIPAAHAFYERVFGLTAMIVEDRIVALVCRAERCPDSSSSEAARLVRCRFAGSFIPPHDGGGPQHFAFAIAPESYDAWKRHGPTRAGAFS